MTWWEVFRMACYVISSIAAGRLFFVVLRARIIPAAFLFGGMTLLFLWYMIEITVASTGVNTREYRVFGTPMVAIITFGLTWWSFRWTGIK